MKRSVGSRLPIRYLALAVGLVSAAHAAERPSDYAFAVPISGTGGDALYRVIVPPSVYEAIVFADLRDVRIFNSAGEVDAHALRPVTETRQRSRPVALAYFPLRGPAGSKPDDLDISVQQGSGQVSLQVRARKTSEERKVLLGYVIDASALKEPINGLGLDWNTRSDNYSAALRVETSDNLKGWTTLIHDAPIVSLLHAGQKLEQKIIEFSARKSKYFRLSWLDPAQALELSAINGLPVEQIASVERAWKEVAATMDADRPGDYAVDLGGLFPVDRIAVRLPVENTVAPVQILSREKTSGEWLPVTRSVVYRLKQNGQELRSPDVAVRPNSHRYWLIRVDAKSGGFGGGTLKVNAGWTPRELVFAARGNGPFLLAYGNGQSTLNALPIETLVPGWGSDKETPLALAGTGTQQALAGAAALQKPTDIRRLGLWAAMGAGVALLAWMAWRLSQQMKNAT